MLGGTDLIEILARPGLGEVSHLKAAVEERRAQEAARAALPVYNRSAAAGKVRLFDVYTKGSAVHFLEPGQSLARHWHLDGSHGWYDLTIEVESDATFRQQLAGHVENGIDSMSDPALGG